VGPLAELVVVFVVVVVVFEVDVVVFDVEVVTFDVVVVEPVGYVDPISPNLMLLKVAETLVKVVFTPPGQEPALPPSSQDMPLAEGSSHKLMASTMPVPNALVKGAIPP